MQKMEFALRLAECRGTRPDNAIGHFRFAEALHRRGAIADARRYLVRARELFLQMEMTGWCEQAEGLRERLDRGETFKWFAPFLDGPPAKGDRVMPAVSDVSLQMFSSNRPIGEEGT